MIRYEWLVTRDTWVEKKDPKTGKVTKVAGKPFSFMVESSNPPPDGAARGREITSGKES